MKRFYTYLHCKPDGTPFYVGKGSGNRAYELSRNGRNKYHQRIVAKYGILIFVFPCETEKQAFEDEIQQIAQLRADGYELCNMTNGGDGCAGRVLSDSSKAKIAAAAKDAWKDPEIRAKTCKAQSEGKRGNKNAVGNSNAKGNTFKHTDDAKRRMSECRKGNKYRLGSKASEETKAKMRAARIGKPNITKRSCTAEEIQKMKDLRATGMSYAKIAKEVKRDYATVWERLNQDTSLNLGESK